MDDDAIRAVVTRLARRHPSGGRVVERAAVLAEGPNSAVIIDWIVAHEGQPEVPAAAVAGRGLHSDRNDASARARADVPSRYVLPAGTLS